MGKRKCHQDTGLGHTYREPASDGHAEANQAQMELLRTGHHGQNHADVLRQSLHLP